MLLPELSRWKIDPNEGEITQVLVYLAASEAGGLTDGKQTACRGKWADWFCHILQQQNLQCKIVQDGRVFNELMVHKLLWACIFWMMSAALGGMPVAAIVKNNKEDVEVLVAEFCKVIEASGVLCTSGVGSMDIDAAVQAVIDYSLNIPAAVPSKEMAVREWRWRNGWVLNQGSGLVEQPLHVKWLQRAGISDDLLHERAS